MCVTRWSGALCRAPVSLSRGVGPSREEAHVVSLHAHHQLGQGPRPRRSRLAVVGAATAATLGLAFLNAPSADAGRARDVGSHSDHHGHGGSHSPAYLNAKLPTKVRVADLLSRMTLAEKVGQMAQAERADVTDDPSQISSLGLGSVLSGGGSVPASNTPEAWADMVDGFQREALKTRLAFPLCVCVARDDRWGRTYESFGESPALVGKMETIIDGLQGRKGQMDQRDHVLATAKHYAGDGLTTYKDTPDDANDYPIDQGIDEVSRAEFAKLALSPYPDAIRKHHVGSVMPSFSSVDWTEDGLGNPIKMSANKELITGVLKHAFGFKG